jgi:TRAP-type transport system periplasmic protein
MSTSISRRTLGLAAAGALAAPGLALGQGTINLRYGNAGNPQTLSNQFTARWGQTLTERTNGQIRVQIFAGTLGGEQRLVEGMSLGLIDLVGSAYTGTREFDILYTPYFFRDAEQAKRVLAGPIGERAQATLERRYSARMIGVGRLGPYIIATKTPIARVEDFRGLKIRTPQIEGCIAAVNHISAAPTPIAFNELYLALQNNTVEGFVSALQVSVAMRFQEVCRYVLRNPFGEALDKHLIATRVWNRLSAAHKQLMVDVWNELEPEYYYRAATASIDSDFATWRQVNGADSVIELPQQAFADSFAPLNERLANEVFGAGAWDIVRSA